MAERDEHRKRLTGLDGLRGIAALLVMLHHYSPKNQWVDVLPYGYVCVDFFFILSGLVMDRTYRPRFARGLSVSDFLRARIARLYPAIAVGIVTGALAAWSIGVPAGLVGLHLAFSLLFVPLPRGDNGIYALDGVQWSLFFELVANLLHVLLLHRLSRRALATFALLSLAAQIAATCYYGSFATGDQGSDFLGGFPRVMTGYTIGILLNRLCDDQPARVTRLSWPILGLLVAAVVVALGMIDPARTLWWIEPLIVFGAFPLILWLGAATSPGPRSARIAAWIGSLSYPIYAVHLPVLDLFRYLALPFVTRIALSLGLTALLALALRHLFEKRAPGSRAPTAAARYPV